MRVCVFCKAGGPKLPPDPRVENLGAKRGKGMDFDRLMQMFVNPQIAISLLGSLIAGALIGAERERQGKAAGLRTHILVCYGSALMTLVALHMGEWVAALAEGTQIVSDMARMPHAILTGIGFLCAGVIVREGASVHGLTTAASLWLTAAIGITFGTGLLELGIVSTVIAMVVLFLLRFMQTTAAQKLDLRLRVDAGSDFDSAALAALLAAQNLHSGLPALTHDRTRDSRSYRLRVTAGQAEVDVEALARVLQREPAVQEFSITPILPNHVAGT